MSIDDDVKDYLILKHFIDENFARESPTHESTINCTLRLLQELLDYRIKYNDIPIKVKHSFKWRK